MNPAAEHEQKHPRRTELQNNLSRERCCVPTCQDFDLFRMQPKIVVSTKIRYLPTGLGTHTQQLFLTFADADITLH